MFFEDKMVKLANIFENQYVIYLTKFLISKVNVIKNFTITI